MPVLLKHLARHLAIGVLAGWVTLAVLLATNVSGLRDVIFASTSPVLAVLLAAFGFAVTFGSLSMGASIMLMPYAGDDGRERGLGVRSFIAELKAMLDNDKVLEPTPVKANNKRQVMDQ